MKRVDIQSIELDNLGFSYGSESVLQNLNFRPEPGDIYFLQGPRGSGKRTLLKLLLGIHPPTQGEYRINGEVMNHLSHDQFDRFRLNIGYAFDVGGLINNHTIYENFKILLDYHDFKDAEHFGYIVSLLEKFKIDHLKHLRPSFVSTGVRKAAAILRALALKPQVLILNNPTQGLSPEHIPHLIQLIEEHREKHQLKFVIIASDDWRLCNQLNGKIHLLRANATEMSA
jgi:phospholipid/cholesterol/gamma-HCH transport system ATP-binding protein